MKLKSMIALASVCFVLGCGDDDQPSDSTNNTNNTNANNLNNTNNTNANNLNNTNNTNANNLNNTNNTNANNLNNTNNTNANNLNNTNNTNPTCDFEAVNGIVVIEAESMPLNEDWQTGTDGDITYIEWTGSSHNNDPTHGVMAVDLRITEPGRYQLQWYTQIGMGTNATEHNDSWVKFPDADDYYGLKGQENAEVRRYWKPKCDDQAQMDAIEALAAVDTADCAMGSTRDGWMKVYSSGATDWKWSARTSDNDASSVMVEFETAGVYTLSMAARADFSRYDRIVLHQEGIDDNVVRDLSLPETACD